jgi:hypothetical protein
MTYARRKLAMFVWVCVLSSQVSAQSASFRGLGMLPDYMGGSKVISLSGDGSIAVGVVRSPDSYWGWVYSTVIWDQNGIRGLGRTPGTYGRHAVAASSDASVIVADEFFSVSFRSWIWRNGGWEVWPNPEFTNKYRPSSISRGGAVVSGYWLAPYLCFESVIIDASGLRQTPLSLRPFQLLDDRTAVGSFAIRTQVGCTSQIPAIVEPDGSVVIVPTGLTADASDYGTFDPMMRIREHDRLIVGAYGFWPRSGGPVISHGGTQPNWVRAVAAQADVFGGTNTYVPDTFMSGQFDRREPATIWTRQLPPANLRCVLRMLGVDVGDWKLTSIEAISDDGRVLVGNGFNPQGIPEAWLAVVPQVVRTADFNADLEVDFFDYLDFVAAFDADQVSADFNSDTAIDFFDYLDFVAAFDTGC